MHAVTSETTIPSFLIGKGLGGFTESAVFGGLSRVRYRDVEESPLPGDDWVRLEARDQIFGVTVGTIDQNFAKHDSENLSYQFALAKGRPTSHERPIGGPHGRPAVSRWPCRRSFQLR